jgi:hypothetical protein
MNEEILKELHSNGSQVFDLPDFETFKADMQDESILSEFRNSMINENFDIPDLETFKSDIGFEVLDTTEKEKEEEEKDDVVKYKSDIDVTEFFSKDPKTQKQKDFSYFDKDFDKLNEDIGGFFGNLEETIVKDLDTKFKKWGFSFEEAEAGSDAIKVISTKDPNINKTFSLDNPNQGMYAIKSFIDKNKRDNAIYADEITDIDVSDDYMQDLFKATADRDEDKKNKLLTGISRKIFASEGISYDEIKNLESKGKSNQQEIDFINNNLILSKFEKISPMSGGVINKYNVEDYKPSNEEIQKYPSIFEKDGSLKINPLSYQKKLEKENERLADITTNEAVYQVRVKEKLLFDKFKNKETSNINEQVDEIAKVSSDLSQKFKSITGSDVSDFTTVNKNIENNLNTFEQELINVTGKGFDDLDKFEPTTQEELDQVQDIVNRYNIYYQQTITPVNNLYSQFSSLGDKQKQISDVGNTINSMLSFDDLYKYRGQYEDSKFQSILNNAKLGWSQGKVNSDFLKAAYNVGDPLNEEEIAGIAKNVAEEISYQKGLLTSDTWERYQAAGTVAEQLKILGTDPGEVLLSLFANSMGMFAGTGKNIALPLIGGSTAAGAVIGGATSLGAGVLPGAFAGFGRGLIAWQTITGFNMELGSAYSEELTKAGYDLSDADQVVAGLRNPEVVAKANKRGIERGVPIAVANFIGARAAGALVNPLATTGKQIGQQFLKGLAVEPLFEGGGELFAQVASDGNVVGTEILNEMIGGMPGTQSNIAVKLAKNTFIDTQTKLAGKLKNLNFMSDNNYGYDDIRAFTNRLVGNKKIKPSEAKQIVENARIVDETNSLMRKAPKFISGRNRTNARNRISDLIQTRKLAENALESGSKTGELIGKIENEINEIATTGKTIKSSDIITMQDYGKLISRTATAGANLINKKLGSDIEVINYNEETVKSLIKNNPDLYNAIKKDINDTTPGFITPEINGKQYIVVNEKVVTGAYGLALAEGDVTGGNVIAHEILHAVLDASFEEEEANKLAIDLEEYILDESKNVISEGSRNRIKNKLNTYEKEYGGKTKEYYQEVFTTLSDEMQEENIDFNRQDRSFWQSIADTVNDFVYKEKNTFDEVSRGSLKLKTAEDAFNFVKDYNKVYKKGQRIKKGALRAKAPIIDDKTRKSIITRGEEMNDWINPKMSKTDFQTKRTVDFQGRMMSPFDAAYAAVNGPVFDRLIGNKLKDTKGRSREDYIQEVKDYLSNLLITFNPQENNNLFAWVNSQVMNKIGTVGKKSGPKTVSTDKTVGDTGRTLADTLASKDEDIESRSIEEAKEEYTLEDKIELSEETNKAITNEVAKVNFTKLTNPYEDISKNKTVTPFISELKQTLGKTTSGSLSPASRAVVVEMGKKSKYVPYLRKNLPFIIKKLPIGYLAKNMPGVVLKSVDGKFTLDWKGKVIDKYTMAETGMTSQPQKMKLKPSITKEDIDNIIKKFAKSNGSPVQSKQEGLAYQIASELGLEKFAKSFTEENEISKSFSKAQDILQGPDPSTMVGKITADVERGIKGIRKSILQTNASALIAANITLPSIISQISNPSLDVKTVKNIIKTNLKDSIQQAVQEDIITIEGKITNIINKITDVVLKSREKAVDAYNKQFKIGPKVNIEEEILKGLDFDFDSPGVVAFFNLEDSMSDMFKNPDYINNGRRSYLDQALEEVKAGKDPLDVIKDSIKWDGQHLKSSSKIGDGGFNMSTQKNDLGQYVVVRKDKYPSNKTNRAQVFENNKDFVDNLLNLISDKYDVVAVPGKPNKEGSIKYKIKVIEKSTGLEINLDTKTPAQKSSSVISEINKNGEQSTYNNRLNYAKEARARIKARMDYLKKKNDPILTAMTMASFKSNMNAILRAAANAEYIFVGDLKIGDKLVYEHMMPAEVVVMALLESYFGKGTINIDDVFDNYHVAIIPESMDNAIKRFGFQQTMPKGFLQDLSKFIERYYNSLTFGSVEYALKSLKDSKVDPMSEEWAEAYKLLNNKKTENKNRLSLLPSGVMPDNENNSYMVDSSIKMTKALDNSIKPNAPVRKIRVFDFDDTLATTKSDVLFTTPDGVEGRLTAEEFAMDGARLLSEGYVFDFSEFNKVTKGKPGPLLDIAKKIQAARGTEDVFVLTARAPEAQVAIKEFLDSVGLNIPLKNITGLGNSTGEAKAQWLISKAAEGYNDFYFADDAYQNVKAVKDALSPLDVKSKIQQAKVRYSVLSNEFNDIIEKNTGIEAFKEYSAAKAKTVGASKGNFKFWIPPSAEDFLGLIYPILGKGKVGDKQMAWFKQNTIRPYTKAMESLSKDRINLMSDFKQLKKQLKVPKRLREKNKSGFTNQQAVRVYLWDQEGFTIPGLSKTDLNDIKKAIESDKELKAFADQIKLILKGDSYSKPTQNWLSGTITTDLLDALKNNKRPKYLQQWQNNVDAIFSEANLNKLEALHGSKYREALENTLARMKAGSNRIEAGSRLSNQILDYINGSVGAIMFFNTRSAILQTISSINFINWSFNNPYKAGKAFANQKQYWKDFSKLMNSDYLIDRRNGQKIDINESEITNAAATSKNKAKAAISYLLQKGFLPTQIADSFAIASGGATFFRNRINDLVSQGISLSDAEAQALLEFREVAEESQQSSDPSKISQQQSSVLGRLILAFQNTPMQYGRLTKRAYQDLINGRGDAKSNISKIIYYTFVQNMIFNMLQQAVFALGFGDDDEDDDKKEAKYIKVANGMLDSQLRGLGVGGAAVSVIKNFLMDIYERSGKDRPEYVDSVWKLMQFSPPISSKISKLKQAAWAFDSKARREEIYEKGFSVDNPAYKSLSKVVSATTNVPLDRLYSKGENIQAALSDESDWWQKVAMLSGWPEWSIMDKSSKTKKKTKIKKKKLIFN